MGGHQPMIAARRYPDPPTTICSQIRHGASPTSTPFTSTLHDPIISEEGRKFLADLLMQLSDQQTQHLFAAARVNLGPRKPGEPGSRHSMNASMP
jgi:hypothetical protein